MSDTAAPPMDRTDWLLSQLAETLERAQRLFEDVAELVDTVRHPDPVTFVTDYASEVMPGDRVQRCHGDPDGHEVKRVQRFVGDDGRDWVNVHIDGTSHYWLATDAIRIETRPVPDPAPYRMVQP